MIQRILELRSINSGYGVERRSIQSGGAYFTTHTTARWKFVWSEIFNEHPIVNSCSDDTVMYFILEIKVLQTAISEYLGFM